MQFTIELRVKAYKVSYTQIHLLNIFNSEPRIAHILEVIY